MVWFGADRLAGQLGHLMREFPGPVPSAFPTPGVVTGGPDAQPSAWSGCPMLMITSRDVAMRAVMLLSLLAVVGLAAGCSSAAGGGLPDRAGLPTVLDSTADTVRAVVAGAVPEGAIRQLVTEVAIAPDADDTSLFTEVNEFDVGQDGRLWVFDLPTNTILLFTPEGQLIRRIGRQGAGPGEFNSNNGMVSRADGGLAIWDARNGRISFLDSLGDYQAAWLVPTGFNTSHGLVTDRSGRLHLRRPVTPPREGEILGRMGLVRLAAEGAFGDSLAPPDLVVPREVYVASRQGNTSSTGARYAPGFHWAWHPDGGFIALNGRTAEVVVSRPGARPLTIRREPEAVPVPEAERAQERASITYNLRQVDPAWSWRGPDLPTTKAPLLGVFAARDGRIWVRVAAPSEPIPPDELPMSADTLRPVVAFRSPVVYEVFSPEGRFLGRVAFPPRATLMEADGDQVWAIVRNEDDLPAVTRLRITPGLN